MVVFIPCESRSVWEKVRIVMLHRIGRSDLIPDDRYVQYPRFGVAPAVVVYDDGDLSTVQNYRIHKHESGIEIHPASQYIKPIYTLL